MRQLTINTQGVWQPLKAGDRVDVVAPARQGRTGELDLIRDFLASWGLEAHIPENMIAEDLLCANTDSQRLKFLVDALNDSEAAAVWCLRGGYGCTRIMPQFMQMQKPSLLKWFIGFSDITVLHAWMNNHWQWPSLHGASLRQLPTHEIDERSTQLLKGILFGTAPVLNYPELVLLNHYEQDLETVITGGNLCLVENSIGTPWKIKAKNKILLLEETSEAAYRVDRSLNHLIHANLTQEAAAIILGDFTHPSTEEEVRIDQVLQNFANQCTCPVYRLRGIGHGSSNLPIALGVSAKISA